MPHLPIRPACWLPLVLLVVGNAGPLASQEFEKPPEGYRSPTIVTAVTALSASGTKEGIWLTWPPASGASEYWVTRVDNKGSQETTIYKAPSTSFVFEGTSCSLTTASVSSNCIFLDKKYDKSTNPNGVVSGTFYSYRVWTGGGPSPVASARTK